jgi:hypothetical protein
MKGRFLAEAVSVYEVVKSIMEGRQWWTIPVSGLLFLASVIVIVRMALKDRKVRTVRIRCFGLSVYVSRVNSGDLGDAETPEYEDQRSGSRLVLGRLARRLGRDVDRGSSKEQTRGPSP